MIVRPVAGGVEVLAPAKLNLFLEILGRRHDGYHEIESLMVAVDLHDRLTIAEDPSGAITLRCDDPTLPTGRENLVVRAAERLKAESGCPLGATISLSKAIPAQAGLAGGSSDAAATLAALDQLWGLRLPPGRLDALAGEIGSDVAFFRHAPAAICRGRGERVEGLSMTQALHLVLVCPPFGLSTADVYRNLRPPERPRPIGPVVEALAAGRPDLLGRGLFNRLQSVAERLQPALVRVRDALASHVPSLDGHLMSGSGSAYFGLGRDRDAALAAARRLETLGLGRVRVVTCGPRAENAS
jgi:4-diphosphocytidyl-2-C-methyl-D-erythritol kinase